MTKPEKPIFLLFHILATLKPLLIASLIVMMSWAYHVIHIIILIAASYFSGLVVWRVLEFLHLYIHDWGIESYAIA